MIFINTRPANRAKPLTDFLQSQGVTVIDLPLLELVACELSRQERHCLNQVNCYQALIFISETAVYHFFDFIQNHHIELNPNLAVITVGQKTADIFKNAWQKLYTLSPNVITPSQFNLPENNEGLLELPVIQSLQKNATILMLKGKDGRTLFKDSLLEKGIQIDEVDFYQRIFPASSHAIFQDFYQQSLPFQTLPKNIAVLISSLTAWQHWRALCGTLKLSEQAFVYLVLQSRLFFHLCQTVSPSSLIELQDLRPPTVLTALSKLQNHSF